MNIPAVGLDFDEDTAFCLKRQRLSLHHKEDGRVPPRPNESESRAK